MFIGDVQMNKKRININTKNKKININNLELNSITNEKKDKQINILNNKGFTLIEILAVVSIIAIVGVVTTHSIINSINTSKLRSESLFLNNLSTKITSYLNTNKPTNPDNTTYTFRKCHDKNCYQTYETTATKMLKKDGTSIYLNDLINSNTISKKALINPKNNEQCFNLEDTNPEIIIYKDTESLYYYYLDLTQNNCHIDETHSSINTIPKELQKEIGLL